MPDADNNFGGSLGLILENDDVTCNPRIQRQISQSECEISKFLKNCTSHTLFLFVSLFFQTAGENQVCSLCLKFPSSCFKMYGPEGR